MQGFQIPEHTTSESPSLRRRLIFWPQEGPPVQGIMGYAPRAIDYVYQSCQFSEFDSYSTTIGFMGMFDSTQPSPQCIIDAMNEAEILATNKFISDLGAVRVNLYDLIRTRKEAVEMVVKKMITIFLAFREVKKGRFKHAAAMLGINKKRPKQSSIPGQWLELNFGWMPLIQDCHETLGNMFDTPKMVITKAANYPISLEYGNGKNPYYETSELIEGHARCQVKSIVMVDEPVMNNMNAYGILNPAAVAWEAVPYSFVLDWFIPVGDYINQFNATTGLLFREYHVTRSATINSYATVKGKYWGGQGSITSRTFRLRRTVGGMPVFRFPSLTNPLNQSCQRYSYAFALLAGAFQRR